MIPELPATEQLAQTALADGTLDSVMWNYVQPFYAQPLCVPCGELTYLQPLIRKSLPSSQTKLERYYPWNQSAIDSFFADYPELVPFWPIISFAASGGGFANSSVSATISAIHDTAAPPVLIGITSQPGEALAVLGRFAVTPNTLRWRQRSIQSSIHERLNLTIGNFVYRDFSPMILGAFPIAHYTAQNDIDNWLYGQQQTWNGILLRGTIGRYFSLSGLLHHRITESIALMEGKLSLPFGIEAQLGVTGSMLNQNSIAYDTSMQVFGSMQYRGIFNIKVVTAVSVNNPAALPVSLSIEQSNQTMYWSLDIYHLPDSFDAPLSAIRQQSLNELELDSIHNDLTVLESSASYILSRAITIGTTMTYRTIPGRSAFASSIKLSGKGSINYSGSYTWRNPYDSAAGTHTFSLALGLTLSKQVSIDGHARTTLYNSRKWRSTGSLQAAILVLPALTLTPGFIATTYDTSHTISATIKQSFMVSEKTLTAISGEFPFSSSNANVYATFSIKAVFFL